MNEKVLCVDDEPNVLQALRRQLRRHFHLYTAGSAAEAIEMLMAEGPFAVIVSDLTMPSIDGVEFLTRARHYAPDTVRILLTGNAALDRVIDAINDGYVFRFLTKPCSTEQLIKAINAGIEQYHLVTAERELLEKTLRGSVKVLTEVLALANPTAFGHAGQVRQTVRRLCKRMDIENTWQYEVAAMLSQLGCLTVPPDVLARYYRAEQLEPDEQEVLEAHPQVGRDLIAAIPRLEEVAEMVAYQQKGYDGSGPPEGDVKGDQIPLGARILKVAIDHHRYKVRGMSDAEIAAELRLRSFEYDPRVLAALEEHVGLKEKYELREVTLNELAPPMVLAQDVKTNDGMLLVSRGQDVTPSMRRCLRNFISQGRLEDRLLVFIRVVGKEDDQQRPAASPAAHHTPAGSG